MLFIQSIIAITGILIGGAIVYLLIIVIAAAFANRELRHKKVNVPDIVQYPEIIVLIPAHNEEMVIANTLNSLNEQDLSTSALRIAQPFQVVVIADNCTDRTAAIAEQYGARVLVRKDETNRGKGYALDWALQQLLAEDVDAFIIIDADTWVAPDFVRQIATRLVTDADVKGYCALQGRYGVLNPKSGWMAGLVAAAFDLFNHVRPLGRDWLGMGVGLKGNGMAFTRAVLEDAHWSGSITEDIDFALDLCRLHDIRVGYVPEARVLGQMPATKAQAASQRHRWETGRYQLVKGKAIPLLLESIRRRNLVLFDAAVDLLIPPMAELTVLLFLWILSIVVSANAGVINATPWLIYSSVCVFSLMAYVLGGLAVAGAKADAYFALFFAPFYTFWKFMLYAKLLVNRRQNDTGWVRTERQQISITQEDTQSK